MEARHIIANDTAFDPAQISVINDALEEAWLELEWRFEGEAVRERALTRLAGILLMFAHHGILDGEPLREAAIHAMERVD